MTLLRACLCILPAVFGACAPLTVGSAETSKSSTLSGALELRSTTFVLEVKYDRNVRVERRSQSEAVVTFLGGGTCEVWSPVSGRLFAVRELFLLEALYPTCRIRAESDSSIIFDFEYFQCAVGFKPRVATVRTIRMKTKLTKSTLEDVKALSRQVARRGDANIDDPIVERYRRALLTLIASRTVSFEMIAPWIILENETSPTRWYAAMLEDLISRGVRVEM